MSTTVDLTLLDEAALARLDAATPKGDLTDEHLLRSSAQDLTRVLSELVRAMRDADVERVARSQGWRQRLTGADLIERARLELAARRVGERLEQARVVAASVADLRRVMSAAGEALTADQARLSTLVAEVRAALAAADRAVPIVARFERRSANLEALHAANAMTLAQFALALDHLARLLDRFADIDGLLYPVWRRHVLAVAQAPGALPRAAPILQSLRESQARLLAAANPGQPA